jgi:CheY-like chemotaxis protein
MDDDAAVRSVGRAMLARLGYEVVTVADGNEAIAAFGDARRAGRPMDVVVMDLTVPGGMGGAEALRALRAMDPAVRAVVTSGYSNDPVMSRYREHGFSGIVTKPYTVDELAAAVADALAAPPP